MALAKLNIILSLSSDALRSQMKAVSSLVSHSMGDIEKLGKVLDNMSKGQGDLFRAPTGRGAETQFANSVTAATAFDKVMTNLEAQLGEFQNSLAKITGPLRNSAEQSLAASVAMKQQTGSLMAFQKQMGGTLVPINSLNAAISRTRGEVMGLGAPVSKLAQGLAYFSLVNYNVRASIESWNALAVLRGPGMLVSLADKINRVVFGLQPPIRILQFLLTKFLIPALVALGMALQKTANNPAAKILGENLIVLAAQMKNLGNSYVQTILTSIAMGFRTMAAAAGAAAKALWAFGNKSVTEAFGIMAVGVLKAAQALGVLAARAAVYAAIKTLEVAVRLLAKTASMAVSYLMRLASSILQMAGNAAKAVGNVLTLGMAFKKTAGDADHLGKSAANASSGFSRWSMLPGIISPSIGLLAGLGVAVGGVALAFKAASMGIRGAIDTEQAVLQFETLLGSAQAAQKRIAELSKFAAETPFTMPDVINANRLLQTFGGSALADAKILKMVGDMAAGAGQDLSGVAMWVGRLYSGLKAGKPIGEAVMRLREMGMITPELEKDLDKLSKTDPAAAFEAFQKAMGRFNGVMQKQSQSIGGLLSTLGDSVSLFFGDLMSGIMKSFNVGGGLTAIISIFDTARTSLVPVVVGMVNSFVAPFMAGISTVVAFVGSNLPSILATFQTVFTPIYTVVSQIVSVIAAFTTTIVTWIGSFIMGIPYLKEMALSLGIVLGVIAVAPVVVTALTTAIGVLGTVLALVASPIGIIVIGLTALGAWILSSLGIFDDFGKTCQMAFWTVEYAIKNWRASLELAVAAAVLGVVKFVNVIIHWFTVALPAYLSWFGRNWKQIFVDLFNGTVAVFSNLFKNIQNFWNNVWKFIESGGTSKWEFAWTPLLDGFKATAEKLPEIAKREIGPLEAQLQNDFNTISGNYNQGLNGFIDEKMKALEEEQKKTNAQISQAAQAPTPNPSGGLYDGFNKSGGKGKDIQAGASALQRGSAEAQSALSRSVGTSNPVVKGQQAQLKETQKQTAAIVAQTSAFKSGITLKVATV